MWQIGIIEGCLGSPAEGRFALAREIGFDAVELSFGARDHESQPMWTEAGAHRTRRLAGDSGITLPSLCATYFNEYGLGNSDRSQRQRGVDVLLRLIDTSAEAGLGAILLPFFGRGAMETPAEQQWAVESVTACIRRATEQNIKLAFEATLPARVLRNVAHRVMNLFAGVYYDVGNVQPAGYDVVEDLQVLSDVLLGVHIKDRLNSGDNVPLGEGDVDFQKVVRGLRASRYRGPLILETPHAEDVRRAEGANLAFLKRILGE